MESEPPSENRQTEIHLAILDTIKSCQLEGDADAPLSLPLHVAKCLNSLAIELPSPELGEVLVFHICFHNNHPSLWKFLHHALSSRLLSPIHLLSLLSARVIPHRRTHPGAYRLYLQLLSQYAFSLDSLASDACKHKIIKAVDAALHLSHNYPIPLLELGHVLVLFFFTILVALIDATFDDWGLQIKLPDIIPSGPFGNAHLMDVDVDVHVKENYTAGRHKRCELLSKTNSLLAMELLAKLTESRKAMLLLRLVHFNIVVNTNCQLIKVGSAFEQQHSEENRVAVVVHSLVRNEWRVNMPEKFNGLLQRLHSFNANKLTSSNMNQLVERLLVNVQRVSASECKFDKRELIWMLIDMRPHKSMPYCHSESHESTSWVSFDIYLENAMDGKQLHIRSSISILTEIIKTLQVFNRASWQETFLALWLSTLRLVQRERDPVEGPLPHIESRLCLLLTIVPLAIANILEDEFRSCSSVHGHMQTKHEHLVDGKNQTSRKQGLLSSLQILGHFSGLLCPPASVISAANIAAAKAACFISNSKNVNGGSGGVGYNDSSVDSGGNLRHLIVEACIARNLINTSVYFWPGYVSASVISMLDEPPVEKSPWLTFMEGAPLNDSLVNLLLLTPAPSLVEVEKLYHISLNGSVEEKSAAAKILCGASLSLGWNIQEHVVHYVVKLLSPPVPSTHTGQRSHLIDYMPMLSAILFGASSVDTVHILSLHGVIPEIAAALMPLCETFGSLMPTSNNTSSTSDEPSIYMVFSAAFLFLLRLWKFYRPPLEQCLTGGGALGTELTLEYLLLLRNSRIAPHNYIIQDEVTSDLHQLDYTSNKPIYIDFFPKLRAWYCQNKSCIASPLSGLSTENPVHEIANKILNMMYWKMTKSGVSSMSSSTLSSNSLCGSPPSTGEDPYQRPVLPAWEVLEAIPFVLEAILKACAHGRLSSRDLTTGLRDLIDFLPASLGAIISYFSAEVTRGVWKPVPMNGIDWPSPAATLSSVESEMKEILSAAGVNFPSCSSGLSPVMLPLPMAALVSLTITFKLNKSLDYIHAVVGPALENCASDCPWPSIPIIGSLWAQKVRRWHQFIVVSCARSVFRRNKEAVAQLLRSCFSSFIGLNDFSRHLLTNKGSVSGLLGSVIAVPGDLPLLAPGFLYLRSCRSIRDLQYVSDVILSLVAEYARESASKWAGADSSNLKSSQASLSLAAGKAREVAILGASLLCVSGGMHLVQKLYREAIPTWLLSSREEKVGKVSVVSRVLEGYAMAYMLILSGCFMWGNGESCRSWTMSRRGNIVGVHMEFVGRVLEGNISIGCDDCTWKAYVCCLVGLLVSFAPGWIEEANVETLKKLVSGLKGWDESELALALLERGGIKAMGCVAELITVIN